MIVDLPGYVAACAAGQLVSITKTASRAALAASWFSTIDLAGEPGAGVLAGTSLAAGIVPDHTKAGYPALNAFTGSHGHIQSLNFENSVACRMRLYDTLWKAGPYPFNAAQALAAQPSFSSRVPDGNFAGIEIWIEAVTAFTGNPTFSITHQAEDDSTGNVATLAAGLAPTIGRMLQIPLAAGKRGAKRIDNVACTVATVGTFNVLVMRRLAAMRVGLANVGDTHSVDRRGLVRVFDTSALTLIVAPDSTATGAPDVSPFIING